MTGARVRAQPSARWLWPGLFLGVFACARQEAPRGGEPDRFPPAVVSVVPEALSTTDDLDEEIQIQFNERISERPVAGTLLDAVVVSPMSPEIRVRHKGDMLEVQVTEGFVPGLVYRVTVLPVIRDLFGNTMRRPFEFVFSTGGAFNQNAVVGQVLDRVTGRASRDALVLAVLPGDSA